MSEFYEVHCLSCGNIEEDNQGNPEQFPFGQWVFSIFECSHCGAKPCDEAGLISVLVPSSDAT